MVERLRIAMVAPVYTTESSWGPITVIKNIVRILKDRGYDFAIYAVNASSPNKLANLPIQEYADGIPVKRYKAMFGIASYQVTPSMFRDLMRDDYDIIHAHCARSFQLDLAALVSVLRGKPLIISAHGTLANYMGVENMNQSLRYLHRVHNIVLRFSLNKAKVVTALSGLETKQYIQLFGVSPSKIVTIPNGVDRSLYEKLPPEGSFRKKYNISRDKIILYVGRISKVKGIDFLIESFSHLVNETKCPNAVLVVAGPDDGYMHEAKLLSHSFGIGDKVIFPGFLTEHEKVCAYVDSTIVVYPESFNVTLIAPLEASASGKPIVLSNGNYLSKTAYREGFGFSVKYGDFTGLAKLLQEIISEEDLAGVMGNKGRQFVLKNLDWKAIAGDYEKLYRRTAEKEQSY
jgi:glycosyltransferase involved in cell wall biosynthesis